jgi:hypothetical protein
MNVNDLTSANDYAEYWSRCLGDLGRKPDQTVAGYMTGVVSGPAFIGLYREGTGDPLIVEVFNLVTSLELPNGVTEIADDSTRQLYWKRVKRLVAELKARPSGSVSAKKIHGDA